MGGRSSKQSSFRHSSSLGSSSSSWSPQGFVPQNQNYASPNYAPSQGYAPPPQSQGYAPPPQYYGPQVTEPQRTFESRYSRIADNYSSLEQVTEALSQAGLESSNLIVGIDFTKSNEWTGARSFNRRSLHHIEDTQNPYEQAISIIGKTLSVFDEDNLIPCFGFGDATTHDLDVFSFYPDESLCNGFEEALARYREIVPHLKLAGPTSFAPIIEMATTIVDQSRGHSACERVRVAPIMYTTKSTETLATIGAKYVGDPDKNDSGYFVEVTRSIDTACGQLSPQEQKTVEAIVKASEYPLSIILVGVGDGPWDMMREFDDNIPTRAFDNFQFVNFTEIMSKNIPLARKETEFALSALMEIPSQYKATLELNILGSRNGKAQERVPLPPPLYGTDSFNLKKPSSSRSFQQRSPPYPSHGTSMSTAIPPSAAAFDNKVCPICFTNVKDMAFGCGHQTCCDCGQNLEFCPICRLSIVTRIKLY